MRTACPYLQSRPLEYVRCTPTTRCMAKKSLLCFLVSLQERLIVSALHFDTNQSVEKRICCYAITQDDSAHHRICTQEFMFLKFTVLSYILKSHCEPSLKMNDLNSIYPLLTTPTSCLSYESCSWVGASWFCYCYWLGMYLVEWRVWSFIGIPGFVYQTPSTK
jgi:hypothetical protein